MYMYDYKEENDFKSLVKERYNQKVKISNDFIIWNETNGKDNTESIVKMLTNDYKQNIENCRKKINDYLKCNPNNVSFDWVDEFSNELNSIHSYFITEIPTERNDIDRKPFQDILVEQLIASFSLNFRKYYKMNKKYTENLMLEYICPILTKINDENTNTDRLIYELTRREQYYDMYNDNLDYNLDTIIINAKRNKIKSPLERIKEALDNLKRIIYIIALDETSSEINTLNLFKSIMSPDLQSIYNEIIPKNEPIDIYHILADLKNDNIDSAISDLKLMNNVRLSDRYSIYCFEQLTYIFFVFVLKFGKNISVCRNCKNIFIAKRPNMKYCESNVDSQSKYKKSCRVVGALNTFEKDKINHTVRNISNRFRMRKSREEKTNIKKLEKYLKDWKEEKDKIINKSEFTEDIIINRLEYTYDILINEYDRKIKQKKLRKEVYPIMYIEPVYDLKVKNDSYMAYVIFGINEKGLCRSLDIGVIENSNDYKDKEYWVNILNELKDKNVENIGILFSENIKAIKEAFKEVFPKTDIQLNVLPLIRSVIDNIEVNKERLENDLLGIYSLPLRNSNKTGDENKLKDNPNDLVNGLKLYWKIRYVEKWLDNWKYILPILKYTTVARREFCKNIVIENFHNNLNSQEYSSIEDLKCKLQNSVNNAVADRYLTPLNNWDKILKELEDN